MTQEGQALPSPTPPESPVEPNTATTDPPTETHSQAEQDRLGAGAKDQIEEGKQQEEIRKGEEEAHGETHREGEGREEVKDEGEEGELKEERVNGTDDEDRQTDEGAEGEREGTRAEGCINMEVSSTREEATHEVEGMKEEEEGKENEGTQPATEEEATHSQQAGRLVHLSSSLLCSVTIYSILLLDWGRDYIFGPLSVKV